MSRIVGYSKISNTANIEELRRYTSNNFEQIWPVINGEIEFGSNIRSQGPIEFKVGAASVVTRVPHTLGYVPAGYFLVYQNAAQIIYAADSGQYPWTTTDIYLTADGAVTGRVILF